MGVVEGKTFLDTLRPVLETGDADALAHAVTTRWRQRELTGLLRHAEADVRRVAAVALSVSGDMGAVPALTRTLRDPDEQTAQLAEHALWSIWFRSGSPAAMIPFNEAVTLLAAEEYRHAAGLFHKASQIDPGFCEAHNQQSIAHYLAEEYERSLTCACRAAALVPSHFHAIAGLGHCYCQLGHLGLALRCYRRALRINPRMQMIEKAIQRLSEHVQDRADPTAEIAHDAMF